MLYGRFDFAYGPDGFKLLEYNADTPTALVETAVQWFWVQDMYGEGGDQWNMRPRGARRALEGAAPPPAGRPPVPPAHQRGALGRGLHDRRLPDGDGAPGGPDLRAVPIEQLGLHPELGFVDGGGRPMRSVFKLYPWEWMVHEQFADAALERMGDGHGQTTWIEPIWKMLWSNKGLLPVLWRLYPDHPNLLPAFFEGEEPQPHELCPQAAAGARGGQFLDRDRRQGGRPLARPGLRRGGLRDPGVHGPRRLRRQQARDGRVDRRHGAGRDWASASPRGS